MLFPKGHMTDRVKEHQTEPQLSVNEVFQKLSKLEQEFEGLLKTAEVRNPVACDNIARKVRSYLHDARVMLLCTKVEDAMEHLNLVQAYIQHMETMLVQT